LQGFAGSEIQRKTRFSPQNGPSGLVEAVSSQSLTRQIRYSADQPNFFADQRIETALSTE
jgi:hypothetical protein